MDFIKFWESGFGPELNYKLCYNFIDYSKKGGCSYPIMRSKYKKEMSSKYTEELTDFL